ncbi:DUF3486 family protein [Desulfofustis glycolicus]|uniref:DUF3486 family protein n=1 Tax=Desulfofustis glycolicus DSM 9705 TaxID=1121409 RepID=A0A1M5S523_9BACT|nr:DUF3486 family protein [Desulfofustis glycolicus]SHH33586.1 Protein of unknown function [Desulfofustis glycolicus DSM 9705]
MGKPSTIDRLPEDILERLQELLRDPRVTQLDATARINEILEADGRDERLSKSAVNRYSLSMRQAGEKLQQSREIAKMWIGKLGAAPQGQVGNLVNEVLRTLAFDLSLKLQDAELNEETIPDVIHNLKALALAAQRLEASATLNVKREAEIRKQALEQAAAAVEDEARAQGMDAEQADFWRRKVLGVA